MDDQASKGLSTPVAVFLTILIITFGISVYNKTRPLQKASTTQEDTIVQSLTANNFSAYDNQPCTGSDVISAINTKASSSLTIYVKTNSMSGYTTYTSASYNISDLTNPNYIEPNSPFHSTVGKTANGSYTSIYFVQQ